MSVICLFQATIVIALIGISYNQQFSQMKQKCCSDSLSPWLFKPSPWEEILRQATYHSIIRHLDFPGSLDGRLERDQSLWSRLQEAEFVDNTITSGNKGEDIDTGILKVTDRTDRPLSFEYFTTHNSIYECPLGKCFSEDKNIFALWKIQKADNPYVLRISVKLPHLYENPTEDIYEYSGKFGLRKLSIHPIQALSPKIENNYRLSMDHMKKLDRSDFQFPNSKTVFGVERGRSLSYDSPEVPSGQTEDGWVFGPHRHHHPGVVVETGIRNPTIGTPFNIQSRPYIASVGPNGFHHIIHSLPSLSSPQNIDQHEDLEGFIPYNGPVNAPFPYKAEYAYDPRFLLSYNKHPNIQSPPAKSSFKPSKEFVRYSEIDPFYHPSRETDVFQTTLLPEHIFTKIPLSYRNNAKPQAAHNHESKKNFPSSINEQIPTELPKTSPKKTQFQIVVNNISSDYKSPTVNSVHRESSTKPINNVVSTTTATIQNRPKLATKTFGEKIKPKPEERYITSTTNAPLKQVNYSNRFKNNQKPAVQEILRPNQADQIITKNLSMNLNGSQHSHRGNSVFNKLRTKSNNILRTSTESSKVTTTEAYQYETTTLLLDSNTEDYNEEDYVISTEDDRQTKTNVMEKTTSKPILVTVTPTNSTSSPNNQTILYDYDYSDETTEADNVTKTKDFTDSTDSGSDSLTSLEDTIFVTEPQSTSSSTSPSTTVTSSLTNIDGDIQESKTHNTQYRLLTYPGDSVSIVANRISKTFSYRTAAGNVGKLQSKDHNTNRYKLSNLYRDYTSIL